MDVLNEMQLMEKKKGITGSTLKIIAIVSMVIDHIAAIVLDNYLISKGIMQLNNNNVEEFLSNYGTVYYMSIFMRCIGRIAFPIFIFLLIEGFLHTRSVKKYVCNLGIFALISEIPFDLGFRRTLWDLTHQNVFFTLFIGLIVIIGFRFIEERMKEKKLFSIIFCVSILAVGMYAGVILKTDYQAIGVAGIAIMYLLRKRKVLQATSGCVVLSMISLIEIPAFFSIIPIKLYNGERGVNLKYLFYAIYPLHILVLYMVCVFMKTV